MTDRMPTPTPLPRRRPALIVPQRVGVQPQPQQTPDGGLIAKVLRRIRSFVLGDTAVAGLEAQHAEAHAQRAVSAASVEQGRWRSSFPVVGGG